MSANLIYDLSQSLFTKLSKLEILILSENKLESIQKNFFDGLYRLKYLDLAQNQIKFLNKDSFFAIIDLENLYLKSNLINNLNGSLCILKNLTILDLSFNELESFKKEDVISNLTFLDLSLNPLKLLESNQKNLYGLKSLKLSSTNSSLISNINFELFTQLEELDLSDNLNINTTQINKLLRLRKLNLRNTNSTDCTFFKNLNGIEELDAGNNKQYYSCLRYLKFSFKSIKISNISLRHSIYNTGIDVDLLVNLIYLDASFNSMSSLFSFDKLPNLIYLDLQFNLLNNIIIDFDINFNFQMMSKLEFINLNNSMEKDLKNFELKFGNNLKHAIISSNKLRIFPKFCQEDESVREINSCNLKTLYFDNNKLDKIKQYFFIFLEKLEYLNLDSNDIGLIDDEAFINQKSLETLIISNNILSLANNTQALFNSLTSIKLLNLSFNFIEIIRMNTFRNLLKLEVLDLRSNKIHSIKESSFKGLINLRDLYINGNAPDLNIENSSFRRFESIKTIFIDKFILNNSNHKSIFIEMVKKKNSIHNKTIIKWSYFKAFNLITLNESFYDCSLVFELINFNIQYNLKTETDFNEYLASCQPIKLKRKEDLKALVQGNKLTINYLLIAILSVMFIAVLFFF